MKIPVSNSCPNRLSANDEEIEQKASKFDLTNQNVESRIKSPLIFMTAPTIDRVDEEEKDDDNILNPTNSKVLLRNQSPTPYIKTNFQRSTLLQKRARFQKTRFCKSVDHQQTSNNKQKQHHFSSILPENRTLSRLSSFRQDTIFSSRNSSVFLRPFGSNPYVMTRRSTISLLNGNRVTAASSRFSSTRSNRSTKSENFTKSTKTTGSSVSIKHRAWTRKIKYPSFSVTRHRSLYNFVSSYSKKILATHSKSQGRSLGEYGELANSEDSQKGYQVSYSTSKFLQETSKNQPKYLTKTYSDSSTQKAERRRRASIYNLVHYQFGESSVQNTETVFPNEASRLKNIMTRNVT